MGGRMNVRPFALVLLACALRSGSSFGILFLIRLVLAGFGQRLAQCLQLILRLVRIGGDLRRRGSQTVEERVDTIRVARLLL